VLVGAQTKPNSEILSHNLTEPIATGGPDSEDLQAEALKAQGNEIDHQVSLSEETPVRYMILRP